MGMKKVKNVAELGPLQLVHPRETLDIQYPHYHPHRSENVSVTTLLVTALRFIVSSPGFHLVSRPSQDNCPKARTLLGPNL